MPWYPYELIGQLWGDIAVSGKTDMDKLWVEGDGTGERRKLREVFRHAKMHAGYRRGAYVAEDVVVRTKKAAFFVET